MCCPVYFCVLAPKFCFDSTFLYRKGKIKCNRKYHGYMKRSVRQFNLLGTHADFINLASVWDRRSTVS